MIRSKITVVRTSLILLMTLLIGAVLGAAILGQVVRQRIGGLYGFMRAETFTEQMVTLIEPTDADQEEALRTIVLEHGAQVEAVVNKSRDEIFLVLQDLEQEIGPLLTDDQRSDLRQRIKTVEAEMARRRNGNGLP